MYDAVGVIVIVATFVVPRAIWFNVFDNASDAKLIPPENVFNPVIVWVPVVITNDDAPAVSGIVKVYDEVGVIVIVAKLVVPNTI